MSRNSPCPGDRRQATGDLWKTDSIERVLAFSKPVMLPNIGVDLLHLPRLASLLTRRRPYLHRFASRILTSTELATFQRKLDDDEASVVRWLGVRWAAKEAAFKAGGEDRRLLWKEVEVKYRSSGQPYIYLPREEVHGGLSISHDGEYVVAMAMLPQASTASAVSA